VSHVRQGRRVHVVSCPVPFLPCHKPIATLARAMTTMRSVCTILFAAALATGVASCSSSSDDSDRGAPTTTTIPADVNQSVSYDPRLTTFATAVSVAGLSGRLQGRAAVTVFVPTNNAFAQLRQGRLAHLLLPAGKRALVTLLERHVVRGRLAEDALAEKTHRTIGGDNLEIERADGGLVVVDEAGHRARILGAPVLAANGVVYVVDAVLG
jgi:uncharacterized surface protein with fasciclin (FAS1) repeats